MADRIKERHAVSSPELRVERARTNPLVSQSSLVGVQIDAGRDLLADGDVLGCKKLFDVLDCMLAEMEDAGRQDRVRLSFAKHVGHVLQIAGSAARHHGNGDGFADSPGDDKVEPCFGTIGVNAVENNFARAKGYSAPGPFNHFHSGGLTASV